MVGSFGDAGCYSTNDYKHISTGDGGFVALRDAEIYRRVSNYSDKHYDRLFDGSRRQQHHAVNYRMGELQGAVAVAQLEKVDSITSRHHELGEHLRAKLEGVPGVDLVPPLPSAECSYKWIILQVKEDELSVDRQQVASALQAEGISCSSYDGYDLIRKPLFQERVVRPWMATREGRMFPFVQPDGREYTYNVDDMHNHRRAMEIGIVITIDTFYTDTDIEEVAAGIWKVLNAYAN
jgi:dTDP-4-amino-4,6-dideoxygalactose transaminase